MLLYLVRHAIAAERETAETDDFHRALTPEGIKKMRHSAEVLRRLKVSISEIWSSPLVRARQTAELLAAEFDPAPRIEHLSALEPDAPPADALSQLSRRASQTNIAFVGHEPFMGECAAYLLTARMGGLVEFKKGGVCCFEVDDPGPPCRARLHWLLTPKIMSLMS